jgi:spermidine synthase
MDSALASFRRDRVITALFPLFLASGATSLVYETLWERQLHLVFGTSQVAVYTVLAAFMTGLAAGGFVAARYVHRVQFPLRTYAILEGAIGLYALMFPMVLGLLEPVYLGFFRAMSPSPLMFAVFQFLLLGIALLPATTCMGATLPLLVRFATVQENRSTGNAVGRLYGANTLGAVIGVGMAGFVLLPSFGLALTTLITAVGNVLLCGVALWLDRMVPAIPPAPDDSRSMAPLGSLAVIALLAGLASLICEVAWFRVMILILGGSAYAFSIMLLSFLLGIGLGGLAGGRLSDWAWARGGVRGVLRWLVAAQLGVAALTYAAMYVFGELPFWFVYLYDMVDPNLDLLWPAKLLLSLMVMLWPALLMGATFPLLVRAASSHSEELGSPVGRLYGWNTVGAILGASVGGLLLLPNLFVIGALLVAVCLNLLAALIAWHRSVYSDPDGLLEASSPSGFIGTGGATAGLSARSAALGGLGVWGVVALLLCVWPPPWDPLMMTAGMYKYVSDLPPEERNRADILAFTVEPYDLLFYEEGLSSVVTVARSKETGNIWLANNGKVDASTSVDMPTQVLVAHLPFAFRPEPEDVMVIGLASGITAGSVVRHSAPSRIDIIELEPAIIRASAEFNAHNNQPLADPRVTLYANDGRNHTNLVAPATYDLVVSEPSNPWQTGVSNLFTREYLELGKSRLTEGGVWSQWIQMYGMDTGDLRSLLGTFSDVYKHVLLFSTIEDADLVLIGSDAPLELDVDKMRQMFLLDEAVLKDLSDIDCPEPEDLLARLQMKREGLQDFAGDTVRNTDDNMRIEFSAPLHLHEMTATENFYALLKKGREQKAPPLIPTEAVSGVHGRMALAEAYARREDWLRATITLRDDAEATNEHDDVRISYLLYQQRLIAELD